ncbi:MAG: carboxypeptidase-like regulatory domain-containing protein, partial [Flavitalea sp.]
MNMRKIFILFVSLFACLSTLIAQDNAGKISGFVQDVTGKSIPSVSVSLFRAKDSSLTKVAVTNKDGKYDFEKIAGGSYFVSGSSVGFEKKSSSAFTINESNQHIELPAIQLSPSAKSL